MKTFLLFIFLGLFLNANDNYLLQYTSKDKNCTLTKNGKEIPSFDKNFKRSLPRNGYTCNAIQKIQYNKCSIKKKKNITAIVFSYGVYEHTNLLFAFKTPTKNIDAMMQVECMTSLKLIK